MLCACVSESVDVSWVNECDAISGRAPCYVLLFGRERKRTQMRMILDYDVLCKAARGWTTMRQLSISPLGVGSGIRKEIPKRSKEDET